MNYPIYNEHDSSRSIQDCDKVVYEFANFVSQLHNQNALEIDAEKGIIALVNSKGTRNLTP